MSKLDNKFRYLLITSTIVTTITAGVGTFIISFNKDKREGSFVKEMKDFLENEEKMEEEFMRSTSYPSGVTKEDVENIDRITSFERANGFCHIYFIYKESNGSHYRVNDVFWINESKLQSNRAFLKEFTTVLEVPDLSTICKKVGYSGKVLVKNNGNKKWIYSAKDQDKEIFEKWSNQKS